MSRWPSHLAGVAHLLGGAVLMICAGCPAPYPAVPHQDLADRILDPLPTYQRLPSNSPSQNTPNQSQPQPQIQPSNPEPITSPPPSAVSQVAHQSSDVRQANYIETRSNSSPHQTTDEVPPTAARSDVDAALTLSAAIDLAYRNNPLIQQAHARLNMAHANRDVAFADFLPQVDGGYRYINGITRPTPGFILPTIASDIGNVAFGAAADQVGMAELRAQWTLWDFGRTTSKFGQSLIGEEIAGLQYVRSQQTVAYGVAVAYFDLLDANAAAVVAQEAVRQAQSALDDAKNYLHRGNAIRNDVLRADVFLKDTQLDLIKAHTAQGVALAKLNQAIGINPSVSTQVVELSEPPRFEKTLAECLQAAVENRREFGVVEHGIAKAKLGVNIADAEFMPKVVVGGLGALEMKNDTKEDAQHASAGIAIQLGLFQGGRRVGELRGANAEVDLACASGKQVCDQIAYEVKVAYLAIDDARQRIDVARTAAAQAAENARVIKSQLDQGDAIPTDVIEAELTLTKAQQGYLIATYDYLSALARLAYAVGLPPESFLAMPCAGRSAVITAGGISDVGLLRR